MSGNVFTLVSHNELLSKIIFSSNFTDMAHSLAGILKTIPEQPEYYNPVITDAIGNSYQYNEANWMLDSINKKIFIGTNFLKNIKLPLSLTFARYIGNFGGGAGGGTGYT